SADDHSDFGDLRIYDKNTYEHIKIHKHNFGHCNAVDYNPDNDSLIIGNNTAKDVDLPAEIYIIHNVTRDIVEKVGLNIDFYDLGKAIIKLYDRNGELGSYESNNKPNACWGETSNIIYVSMNRNKVIYRIFLGEGVNDLSQLPGGWGVFNNSPYLDYNGTCRVLGRYDMIKDHGINQDMTYHNGKI